MDGDHVWAVDAHGTSGTSSTQHAPSKPSATLDDLGCSANQWPTPDYAVRVAFRDALDAFADYVDTYRAGVA
ncbi:hypothetical protein ACFC96_12475 [Streptomyces sp. NPDC055955]|uniref:hypothetical protein n=1 Tax=Streptomyces sp. NPDC055955 TaxID=3345665 RepID=UPI0035DF28F7